MNNNNLVNQNEDLSQKPVSDLNDKWNDLTITNQNTKKRPPIRFLFIFLIIIIVIGGIFFGYVKLNAKKDYQNDSKPTAQDSKNENVEENKNEEDKDKGQKPEIKKDCVKNADYKTDGLKDSYYFYKEKVKLSDIVVPYLDIDSPAAAEINNEIKALYEKFIEMYISFSNEGLSLEEDATESYDYIKTSYTYVIENDIISILIKVNRTDRGSSEAVEYYTFNYDIEEEKKYNFEELSNKFNIKYDDVVKKANEALETTFDKAFGPFSAEEDIEASSHYVEVNKNYFNEQLKNKTVKSFIDEEKQLNIIIYNEHPFGGCGFYEEIVPITK